MPDSPDEFRQRLLDTQEMTPALRASYHKDLAAMLHPKLTARTALPGIVLLTILVVCIAGLVRNMIVANPAPLVLAAWAVLIATFTWAALLIVRDLRNRFHSRNSQFSIAGVLTMAGGAITVSTLLQGLGDTANPASTFNVLFVFVFYFACAIWALESRIATAELAAKEQMLRIEYRLVDLIERLQPKEN